MTISERIELFQLYSMILDGRLTLLTIMQAPSNLFSSEVKEELYRRLQ